jgi:hypothetical protein
LIDTILPIHEGPIAVEAKTFEVRERLVGLWHLLGQIELMCGDEKEEEEEPR